MNKRLAVAFLCLPLAAESQQAQRLFRVMVAFEPRATLADSLSTTAAFRDGAVKVLKPGPPLIANGKVTTSSSRAKMVMGLVNIATGALLAKDSVTARLPTLRDSARVLGARLARSIH
ncbi:MAG: hypothetical protein JWM95_2671 [Gemmatimonadetes bacterium]|nr:hypothetical protein [Gemmatimonadota bacterium]